MSELDTFAEKMKNGAYALLGLLAFVVVLVVGLVFIYGLVWISAKLYPIVEGLSVLGLVVLVLSLIPSLIFKRIRPYSGTAIMIVSYLWGAGLWMYSILVLHDLWGIAGIYVGFFTFGVVTVPLACIALLFKGEWSLIGELIIWLLIVLGIRALGYWIASKGPESSESELDIEGLE